MLVGPLSSPLCPLVGFVNSSFNGLWFSSLVGIVFRDWSGGLSGLKTGLMMPVGLWLGKLLPGNLPSEIGMGIEVFMVYEDTWRS